nr:DNA mismatch repair protein MLH3 isoform X1 [Tanacetum cinerariifolium]
AIMFGDALLLSECSLIVEELKQTSMCFQCAHGRPTTAPLVNLVELHKQIIKLENGSHGSSGPWHGLTRHRPSLERAAQRLSSGGG